MFIAGNGTKVTNSVSFILYKLIFLPGNRIICIIEYQYQLALKTLQCGLCLEYHILLVFCYHKPSILLR